jgi:hypothetical protein
MSKYDMITGVGGEARPFVCVCKHTISSGIWGHAPPGNICILYSLIVHSQVLIWYYLNAGKHTISNGVWGHAPPGNFCILDSLRLFLVHSQALNAGKHTISSGVWGYAPPGNCFGIIDCL